jgi:2-polyprenyl-3-methyl-5-hydroxy-6-metoxy-1,4-benzoquinol methylase
MEIHDELLSDVARYIESHRDIPLERKQQNLEAILRLLGRFTDIAPGTRMLEIGTGTGWIPILCKKKGLSCRGIEISPHLIDLARQHGARYGIEPEIEIGNIEAIDLGREVYDVIIATSCFEHVEDWRRGLKTVYRALKKGGVFFFQSTNKFSPVSGEYNFPFYGWLPDQMRYRLRVARQGEDIMKLGIDSNQFTYVGLSRHFKKIGFARVLDRVDYLEPSHFPAKSRKRRLAALLKGVGPLKCIPLFFAPGTSFICIK